MNNFRLLPAAVLAALIAGCSSAPTADSPLAQARIEYSSAQSNGQVASLAAGELKQASDSLDRAKIRLLRHRKGPHA